jgi:Ser/Thr protein kinase RdoA (MazF antagonist)
VRPRTARLFLVDPTGVPLGVLPPLPVDVPWWQEVGPVVAAARDRFGVEVVVLRLLRVEDPGDGRLLVSYLAEATERPRAADPWAGDEIADHPLRRSYAQPGGPARDLAWVDSVLAEQGLARTAAVQVKTWNLSSVWRITCTGRHLWLKVVPPFFAHEPAVLEALAGAPAPRLLAAERHDGQRMLMEECPGPDLFEATGPLVPAMIDVLVDLQVREAGRAAEWLARGVPDGRLATFQERLGAAVRRHAAQLEPEELRVLDQLVAGLPRRCAEVEATGLPDTLVHGDFHRGNVRGALGGLRLLDWGDSFVGHPLFDQWAFTGRLPATEVPAARERWRTRWEAAVPGSDPARAAALLAPLAVAFGALVYQRFLDHIEPSEHPYHDGDPLRALQSAAALLR